MQERYKHRDISWLDFNYRVLQKQRTKMCLCSNELNFLLFTHQTLTSISELGLLVTEALLELVKVPKKELDYQPSEILEEILAIVNDQQMEFFRVFEREIIPDLKGITFIY